MLNNGLKAPDRLWMNLPGLSYGNAKILGRQAQRYAQQHAPKLTGFSSRRIVPIYGKNFFGLRWMDPQVWYQNAGVKPFSMRSLNGKTIPMWIDDPTGQERAKNPKLKTRTTEYGRTQVLIFRKAKISTPRFFSSKTSGSKNNTNIGVSWYFPGLTAKNFLQYGINQAVLDMGLQPYAIQQGYNFYENTNKPSPYPEKSQA